MDRIATASTDFAVNRATREDVADIATLLRDEQGTPVGTLQLTFVPGLSRGGAMRMTSDKRRPEPHRFYERLGYVATHEGFTPEV